MKQYRLRCEEFLRRLPGIHGGVLFPLLHSIEDLEALKAALDFYVIATSAPEPKKCGTSFPVEYKGWRIEIRMGHEWKGSRGSVRKKRGYIATRLSDGRVHEFPPSYDTTPSVQAVKAMIDAEERAQILYGPKKPVS